MIPIRLFEDDPAAKNDYGWPDTLAGLVVVMCDQDRSRNEASRISVLAAQANGIGDGYRDRGQHFKKDVLPGARQSSRVPPRKMKHGRWSFHV